MTKYFLQLKGILKSFVILFLAFFSCQPSTYAQEPIIAINNSFSVDPSITTLGEKLFHDPRLSNSNSISCATCHPVGKATMDGLPFSNDIYGKPLAVNTPSLDYVVLNHYFAWTGRFPSLEKHLSALIQNPRLFDQNWPQLIAKLSDNGYSEQFQQAGYDIISQNSITEALITFQRSLVTPSRFDLFLTGDLSQLSPNEALGYKLFKNYGCISCHQGINIGGNMRQKFGVMEDYFAPIDTVKKRDLGYFNTSKKDSDKFNFRVPSLRNVSLTAPYFHDASATSLQQAIEVMVKYQLGVSVPDSDIKLIESFLNSLEGINE